MTTQNLNDQLGLAEFTECQKTRFSDLLKRVSKGEISANQAYRYAQVDGDSPEDKGFKGSFKEWIETTKLNEWVSAPKQNTQEGIQKEAETSDRSFKDYLIPIGVGVVIAVVLVYAIKKFGKKE